jgi:hypothetical protein
LIILALSQVCHLTRQVYVDHLRTIHARFNYIDHRYVLACELLANRAKPRLDIRRYKRF